MTRTRHPITDQPPEWSATVSARVIRKLAPMRGRPDDATHLKLKLHCYRIEPHPSGSGVTVVTTDGHIMGIAYDRDGQCSHPVTAYLPPEMVAACTPPTNPITYDDDGDPDDTLTLSAWARPSVVHITPDRAEVRNACAEYPAALYLWDRKPHGGELPRNPELVSPEFYADTCPADYPAWRHLIPSEMPEPRTTAWTVNPHLLAKFASLATDPSQPMLILYTPEEDTAPAVVRAEWDPDVMGLIMGVDARRHHQPVPTWATETAPASSPPAKPGDLK